MNHPVIIMDLAVLFVYWSRTDYRALGGWRPFIKLG